jgi:zinc transport system substrate-binding protein
MMVVDTLDGITKLEMTDAHADEHAGHADEHDAHEKHHHHGGDPHVWLSPRLVKQQAVTISEALIQFDPQHRSTYLANREEFLEQIDKLDRDIQGKLANLTSRTFLVFHPSWSYFAHDYNLTQLAIEIEGKEPSAAEMIDIISTAQAQAIRVIFVQPQTSRRSADTIARQIAAKVEELDPLAQDWLDNMRTVATILSEVLAHE